MRMLPLLVIYFFLLIWMLKLGLQLLLKTLIVDFINQFVEPMSLLVFNIPIDIHLKICPSYKFLNCWFYTSPQSSVAMKRVLLRLRIRHMVQVTKWNACCAASSCLRDGYKRSVKPSLNFSKERLFLGGLGEALQFFLSSLSLYLFIYILFLFQFSKLHIRISLSMSELEMMSVLEMTCLRL